MKLGTAMICLNCDEIYERESDRFCGRGIMQGCNSCGSNVSWPLAKWITALNDQKMGQAHHTDAAPERILI